MFRPDRPGRRRAVTFVLITALALQVAGSTGLTLGADTGAVPPGSSPSMAIDRATRAATARLADPVPTASGAPVSASDLRVAYGRVDRGGCHALDVWHGSRLVTVIPTHGAACRFMGRREIIGGRLYFEWVVERSIGGAAQGGGTRRRTDLWVTDGTIGGTARVVTLHDSEGVSQSTCGSGWGLVANRLVAAAEWCRDAARHSWVSGRVIVAWGARVERKPVPRPWNFAIADQRIVTTGEDAHGRELWVHDGRMRVVDLRPGPTSSNPHRFLVDGQQVRFIANDGHGRAAWVTDGTRQGTHRVGAVGVSAARYPLAYALGTRPSASKAS